MNTISRWVIALVLLSGSIGANAEVIVTLDSVTPDGSNFDWNYIVSVLNDARLDPAATNGASCIGGVPCSPVGTFLTIYDIAGLVSATASAVGFNASVQITGVTPQQTAPIDSSLPNVTFAYTGSVVTGPVDISGFTIVSSYGIESETLHNYTSQSTSNVGSQSGQSLQLISVVGAPTTPIPLPASVWFFGSALGLLGLAARRQHTG